MEEMSPSGQSPQEKDIRSSFSPQQNLGMMAGAGAGIGSLKTESTYEDGRQTRLDGLGPLTLWSCLHRDRG